MYDPKYVVTHDYPPATDISVLLSATRTGATRAGWNASPIESRTLEAFEDDAGPVGARGSTNVSTGSFSATRDGFALVVVAGSLGSPCCAYNSSVLAPTRLELTFSHPR